MHQTKWFERKFNFTSTQNIFLRFLKAKQMRQKYLVPLFLFSIFTYGELAAQNLKLGFQVESTQYYTNTELVHRITNITVSNQSSVHGAYLPTSLYIKLDFDITDEILLGVKSGYLGYDDYSGIEAGIFSKYKIYKFINLIAFYNYHSNNSHSSFSGGTTSKGISLLGTGVGFNVNETIIIELLYSIPITESQIGYKSYLTDSSLRSETSLKSIIKLGIGFSWSL